jgi:hypothetical protein
MGQIRPSEFAAVPYVDANALGGRVLLLMPFWDGAAWHHWCDLPDGRLLKLEIVDAARSNYIAKSPARAGDLCIPFIDFMWQRVSAPDNTRLIQGICDDFHLLATGAGKLRHLFVTRKAADPLLIESFVKSELEYMITTARSVFDLLQEVVAGFWNERVTLLDADAERRRRQHRLPRGFGDVVLEAERLRTADALVERYGLPPSVAAQYVAHAQFFVSLRAARDRIIHGGTSFDTVYITEKGFCVDPRGKAFRDFSWTDAHRYNENIVSLLPWVADLLFRTVQACTELVNALASVIRFPPEVAPGYRIFLRDPANDVLLQLNEVLAGTKVWWDSESESGSTASPRESV